MSDLTRRELLYDAWVDHDPTFLDPDEATELQRALSTEQDWQVLPIWVFGKQVDQPRELSWVGDLPYRYSGLTLDPRPLSPTLQALLTQVEAACGASFNHIVLNRYAHGRHRMGMHADDEPELGDDPLIASLSLGATRTFVLEPKDRRRRKRKVRYRLTHGSLLVMGGRIQHTWYHGVPGDTGVKDERINLTFRQLHGPPGWRSERRRRRREEAMARAAAARARSQSAASGNEDDEDVDAT